MKWNPRNVESGAVTLTNLLKNVKTTELFNMKFESGFDAALGVYNLIQ